MNTATTLLRIAWNQCEGLENRPQFPTFDEKPPQILQSQFPGTSSWVSSPGDSITGAHKAHFPSKGQHYSCSGHASASHSFGISFYFRRWRLESQHRSASMPDPCKQPGTASRERGWGEVLGVPEQVYASPAVPSGTLTSLCTSWTSRMFHSSFREGKAKV